MVVVAVLVAMVAAGAMQGGAGAADEVEVAGTLVAGHGDDFAAGHSVDEQVALQSDTGVVRLQLPDGTEVTPGDSVRLRGRFQGQTFVVAAGGVRVTGRGGSDAPATAASGGSGATGPAGGTTLAAGTPTMKSLAVILMNFSNDTGQPWTTATVRGVVFDNANSVNAFYQDASDGQVGFAGDVFGWYTIPSDNSGCAYDSWASQARTAATNAGVNLSAYQYVQYAFPSASSCGWAGLAYLSSGTSFINGAMGLRTVAHELGHNLGVHHASSFSCTNAGVRVTLSATCTMSEYGDPFTVMGASSRLHHGWHRAQMGFPKALQTVTTSGDYWLAPNDDAAGSPRQLTIARSDGTYYQLEYRQPTGIFDNYSASDPVVNGVTIRITPSLSTVAQSKLLDATPETTTFNDAPLPVGRTYLDPATGMQISTRAIASNGATVTVAFTPDGQLPSAPGSLTANASSSSSITLTWTAATDNVGVAEYRVLRNGVQVATTTALSFVDSALLAGTTYGYQVVAVDAAGNVGPAATASATTPVPDTQAPSVPTGVKAVVGRGGAVSVTWTASTDNVGVAGYRVLVSGVQAADVTGTSATVKVRKGTSTITVVAYDRAGNVSGPSSGVTVKV